MSKTTNSVATIIRAGEAGLVLINVFTVDPARQEEFIKLLEGMTAQVMRNFPGFVSANIHRGLDGRHVANYAQWESREAFDAMMKDPDAAAHRAALGAVARSEAALYTVVSVHH